MIYLIKMKNIYNLKSVCKITMKVIKKKKNLKNKKLFQMINLLIIHNNLKIVYNQLMNNLKMNLKMNLIMSSIMNWKILLEIIVKNKKILIEMMMMKKKMRVKLNKTKSK